MLKQTSISKRTGWLLFLFLAGVFLVANLSAYSGYFQDDEINSMSWTRWAPVTTYLAAVFNPVHVNNFRPVGFFYFREGERLFGLHFAAYVAILHVFHLLNAWMLWLLLRRLGTPALSACVGVAFFTLHAALFDTVWKPMYVFDLLCTTFCLASLVLWTRGRWLLSFAAFWLAYQSKELAVMLPAVLVCYELWFGTRRWWQLAPFLAASAVFVGLSFFLTPAAVGPYQFHFTPKSLAKTSKYYAGRAFLIPLIGYALPVAAYFARNRRAWFGLAAMVLFFLPLFFLPGRIFSAYCYLPFLGLAIAITGLSEKLKPAVLAVCIVAFLGPNIYALRKQTVDTLRADADIRQWMDTVGEHLRQAPLASSFIYEGLPAGFWPFGAQATLRYYLHRFEVPLVEGSSPEAAALRQAGTVDVLHWNTDRHVLEIR